MASEIEMVMVAAARVEGGLAGRADRIASEIGGDGEFRAAGAAEDGRRVTFG
jgi:hypothetical protein